MLIDSLLWRKVNKILPKIDPFKIFVIFALVMTILENVSLKPYNTFGIVAHARFFVSIESVDDLGQLIQHAIYRNNKRLILGGGSNILFSGDYSGLIIPTNIKGTDTVEKTESSITIKVGGGEVWHDLVMHCVSQDWGGVENLSLIPGTVGASPIQNIGAYGVEVKDVIDSVETIDLETGDIVTYTNAQCRFGYRESIFKQELKEKKFISSVTLTLTKNNHHFHTGYGAIQDTLKVSGITTPSVKAISDAVVAIRSSKLPDPTQLGNAGSFFKNPVVTQQQYELIKTEYPTVPGYTSENQFVKIPAGWLIEQCGWKGKRIGRVGVHQHQALVLVNYGDATGEEVLALSSAIQTSVMEKFNVQLQREVNVV